MRLVASFLIVLLGLSELALACSGDVHGFWEKRGKDSDGPFEVIEEFRIDSGSGVLSVCGSDNAFDAGLVLEGDQMEFGYRRRLRVLTHSADGTYLSGSWLAEHQGVTNEYRIRAFKE